MQAAKILCIVGTSEHDNPAWSQPFFEALVDRGHKLTLVSTATDPKLQGLEHIPIKNDYDAFKLYVEKDRPAWHEWDVKQMLNWYEGILGNCRAVIQNGQLDALQTAYDLIIYDATNSVECLLSRLTRQQTPVLALSGGKLTPDLLRLVSAENTINPARIPHFSSRLPVQMNYWHRLQNHLIYVGQSIIRWGVIDPVLKGMLQAPYHQPEVQLVLLNTHPVLDYVQNLPPNVIEVGGLHIRAESAPLPLYLQNFVQRFPEGLVYINLPYLTLVSRSGVQDIQHMIKEFTQFGFILNSKLTLARKFNNLKTIDIDGTLQQDIISQSNTKAVISHGDSFELQEAIYNAVPVIVLPLLFDQPNNAKRIDERHLGVHLISNSTGHYSFNNALRRIVRERIFFTSLQQAQFNFRTRQAKPVNEAVWYVEQLMADPNQFKYLAYPDSMEQSYFVSQSIDVLILPLLFVTIFIVNFGILVVQIYKAKNPNSKDKTKVIERKFTEKMKELKTKKSLEKLRDAEKKYAEKLKELDKRKETLLSEVEKK
ncbi:hypothetical protein KR093_000153, partial [Drosophila rubida]